MVNGQKLTEKQHLEHCYKWKNNDMNKVSGTNAELITEWQETVLEEDSQS